MRIATPAVASISVAAIRAGATPAGLRTVTTADAGSTSRNPAVAGSPPGWLSRTRVSNGLLYSCPTRTIPPARQSPAEDVTAYSKRWLQCWNWKFAPSGVDRRGGSIQTPDGHPLHDRISERYRLPSDSTLKPGRPRLRIATVRSATMPVDPSS